MFLAALLACAMDPKPADEATPPTSDGDPAPDDDGVDTGTDTGPDDTAAEPAWSPRTFYVTGQFGYDPAVDGLVSWNHLGGWQEPHLRFDFFDDTGWACVATMQFPELGDGAPVLDDWTFRDTVTVEDMELEATMRHTGFAATPAHVISDCPPLDAAAWGADSVDGLLLAHDWGVGFGPVRADKAYDASAVLWGGSIYSEALATGTPPVDAVGYASAAELDERHAVRLDIDGRPILHTFDEVHGDALPRALYVVDAATWFDAGSLAID